MNKNNPWKISNAILIIIIIIILFVRCNNKKLDDKDIYNINLSNKQNNCILEDSPPGDIIIEDHNGNYLYQKEINIFNSLRTISPGISNKYYFTVKNQSDININYKIELDNISNSNINIKYRLKRNNDYIVGNDSSWVSREELKTTYLNLSKGNIDNYILDWKWFDNDDLDNYVGKSKINKYIVKLNFHMEETDSI